MELQFNKSVFPYLGRAVREVQNQEQTQEIRLPDGMPDIGRVLSAWGQVILRSKEWRSDSMSFSGGLMVWVLYAPEDGTQARCVDSWIPFQMRWELPNNVAEGSIRILCQPRFVDARSVSARKLMVRGGIWALGEAMTPTEGISYAPVDLPEDVQLLRGSYPVRLFREAGEKDFQIDEELTLPGSYPMAEKLIYYTVRPEITEQKVSADKVVFRGNGNLHVLYRSEEGQLKCWEHELPFSQLAQLKQTYGSDALADVNLAVTGLELELDDEGHLRLKCGLLGQYLVDDREMLELVEDAYSPARAITIRSEELNLPAILEKRQELIHASQSVTQNPETIIDSTFLPDQPRQIRTGEGVALELPGQFGVLFYGEDGSVQGVQARWEGQWNLDADDGTRMDALIQPKGSPQAAPGGDGIAMKGDALLNVDTIASQGMPMVTGLELGELREPDSNRPSVILRRAGKERLWDIAKGSGSTVDAIRKANRLESEPEADRMLLIPVG